MPLFDLKCQECGHEIQDELLPQNSNTVLICPVCESGEMVKMMAPFGIQMVPGDLTKAKRRLGNKLPDDYQTTGGCNVYKPGK